MIALIDYGRGNLASVANALKHLSAPFKIVDRASDLPSNDAVILPGVGAFDDAAGAMAYSGLSEALRSFVATGKPFLGICLGMQLLFESSAEGNKPGLGLLAGKVLNFASALPPDSRTKIPHMGWNQIHSCRDPLLVENSELYFVHSYFVQPEDQSLSSAFCHYEIEFTAAVLKDNIRAYQFHPEKSAAAGLRILSGFLEEIHKYQSFGGHHAQ